MTNPLKHAHELGGVSEAYKVVRTAVVVLDRHTYRIDVLKGYVPPTTAYTARCTVPWRVPGALLSAAPPFGQKTQTYRVHRAYGPTIARSSSCIPPRYTPYSPPTRGNHSGGITHGLEAPAGVYHGLCR